MFKKTSNKNDSKQRVHGKFLVEFKLKDIFSNIDALRKTQDYNERKKIIKLNAS